MQCERYVSSCNTARCGDSTPLQYPALRKEDDKFQASLSYIIARPGLNKKPQGCVCVDGNFFICV